MDLLLITDLPRFRKIFSRIADEFAIQLRVANSLEAGGAEIVLKKPDIVFVQTNISALSDDLLLMHLKKQLGRRRSRFVLLGSAESIIPDKLKLYHGHIDTSLKDNTISNSIREYVEGFSSKGEKVSTVVEPEAITSISELPQHEITTDTDDVVKQTPTSNTFVKMYQTFFHLKIKPFELLPNPEFLFLSKSHKKAMTLLEHAIHEHAGFILLTGEIGAGKTTVIRALVNKYHDHTTISKLFNTRLNPEQLLAMINDDFGLPVANRNKVELLQDLNEFLIGQYAKKNEPLLIIDEAQNLSLEVLEEIRMLSNLETDRSKLLHIILVGQPELRQSLALPGLIQLQQRIAFSCHLQPLMQEEVGEYIIHRLRVAGNSEAAIFSQEALDMIWCHSRGIPRLINTICDFLLLSAFADNTRNISKDLVKEVVADLDFEGYLGREGNMDTGTDSQKQEQTELSGQSNQDSDNHLKNILEDISTRLDNLEKRKPIISDKEVTKVINHSTQCGETFNVISNQSEKNSQQDQRPTPLTMPITSKIKKKKGIFGWLFGAM